MDSQEVPSGNGAEVGASAGALSSAVLTASAMGLAAARAGCSFGVTPITAAAVGFSIDATSTSAMPWMSSTGRRRLTPVVMRASGAVTGSCSSTNWIWFLSVGEERSTAASGELPSQIPTAIAIVRVATQWEGRPNTRLRPVLERRERYRRSLPNVDVFLRTIRRQEKSAISAQKKGVIYLHVSHSSK